MCLAQGPNTVTPVRLEPATSWSRDKHSTNELPSGSCSSSSSSGSGSGSSSC